MRPVKGMSVVITGGGSGIGATTARHFVARGAKVTVFGRRERRVRGVAEELGEACAWVAGDATDGGDRQRLVERAVQHGGSIDLLVNAAANMYRGNIDALDEDQLLGVFHSNVVAAMMLTGLAVPYLVERRGCVVFFGSVHAKRAFPGASPYAATKGALEAVTGVLAAELGPRGVRVSCVRPGGVFSELNQRAGLFDDERARARLDALGAAHALGRPGTPEEVAEAIEYLARAEWTTGAVLVVDGGLSLGTTNA